MMRVGALLVVFACLIGGSVGTAQQTPTEPDLLSACEKKEGYCEVAIGVALKGEAELQKLDICSFQIPFWTRYATLREILVKFMRADPDTIKMNSQSVIATAFAEVYPCEQ